jgi:signal transduction histidine kinase
MISIRARLLWSLLPAFVGIFVAAGFGIYFSTKAELVARLDTQLAGLAVDLQFARPQPERTSGRNRLTGNNRNASSERAKLTRGTGEASRFQSSLFTNLPANVFCEVNLKGGNLKTDNLQDQRITRPALFPDDPLFYDATLPDGEPLRAWASRLSINRAGREPEVILAIDRNEMDATLVRLAQDLVGGGIACCMILTLILIATLRGSLRPLRNLGEQAALMDAESLHERFPEKNVPADIRPIVVRLNSLMAKLEESFLRERRFSGDLAHELRTPLAAIRTTSEVAIKWPDQASPDDFEEIHKIAANLQETLDSLLLLARMESSTPEKNIERVKTTALAEECRALHATRAEERGLRIELGSAQTNELETDPRLLRIIISNLIGNAVEYAPEGSTIVLETGTDDTWFQCRNAAPNLAADDVAHLFERMWRKDAARTESGHAGLGLSIANACANALDLNLCAKLDEQNQLCVALERIP